MNVRARPTALFAPIGPDERVEEIRRLFCPCYESCLDEALRLGWSSFTCVGCALFAPAGERGVAEEHARFG